MPVFRCPYCGERIKDDGQFCSHCGKQFDRPNVDGYSTYHQEVGGWLAKSVGIIILWFILLLVVGFISKMLGLPKYDGHAFIFATLLTFVIVVFLKLK